MRFFINITDADVAVVSDEDEIRCCGYTWHKSEGYFINNQHVRMHVLIMGAAPAGYVIDHIDKNKLNNQRHNLRYVTHQVNLLNNNKRNNPNHCIYKQWGRFRVRFTRKSQLIELGIYDTIEQARLVRDEYLNKENETLQIQCRS